MNPLRFEWDTARERANRRRHGVSFNEAQSLFHDERAIRYDDPDHSESQERFIMLGERKLEPRWIAKKIPGSLRPSSARRAPAR